ncbi:MAG: ABC transporter ATP-binding protein [Bacteroidota bacterium]
MMNDVIVIERLRKVFTEEKRETVAVDDISLQVRKGEVFSLVGPDGAGKTTMMRMLCGVLPPKSGSLTLLGLDYRKDRDEIKKHIGYLSQRFSLYGDLTIDENIDFFAEIHKVLEYGKRKEELLQFTRLTPFRDRLAGRLSGGMKQKLALACTLIHTPEIIVLDEPTTGVDPVSRRDFWKILSSLLKSGITIVVSTPYLDEAERSTRVALMNEGKLLMCDTPEAVKSSFPHRVLEVVCSDVRKALEILQNYLPKSDLQLFGDRLHLLLPEGASPDTFMQRLRENDVAVTDFRTIQPSLEDVFISRISST